MQLPFAAVVLAAMTSLDPSRAPAAASNPCEGITSPFSAEANETAAAAERRLKCIQHALALAQEMPLAPINHEATGPGAYGTLPVKMQAGDVYEVLFSGTAQLGWFTYQITARDPVRAYGEPAKPPRFAQAKDSPNSPPYRIETRGTFCAPVDVDATFTVTITAERPDPLRIIAGQLMARRVDQDATCP